MTIEIHRQVDGDYQDFLRDESRRMGTADSISFPTDEQGIIESLEYARKKGLSVTTQGSRTGITGGAVSEGGHIINLSRMNRITGLRWDEQTREFVLTAQPGMVLGDLREAVLKKEFDTEGWSNKSLAALEELKAAGDYLFAPDPTEWSASIGGMAACNASGAKSFFYGATGKHIVGLRVVLADGDTVHLHRGEHLASGRSFSITTDSGQVIVGALPTYDVPAVKSAAGYYAADHMDLIDLFIGSEGTLGLFPEIELRLMPAPAELWGVLAFFGDEASAVRFVRKVRRDEADTSDAVKPAAIELFGHGALSVLRNHMKAHPGFADIPVIPDSFHTGIYVEFMGDNEDEVSDAVMAMSEMIVACGGHEDDAWMATDNHEWERLREFRHAVPECVNLLIDERRKQEPKLTKLGTDMSVPNEHLEDVIELYRSALEEAGLEHVLFGHISSNHIHVNILPRTLADYDQGKQLYLRWADEVIKMGGSISAEHGIGKIKKGFLQKMYGEQGIAEMKAVKALFDPDGRLNPGNLFG